MKLLLKVSAILLGMVIVSATVVAVHDWIMVRSVQNAIYQAQRSQHIQQLAWRLWREDFYRAADAGARHWQFIPGSMAGSSTGQGEWVSVLNNPPYPERAAADWSANRQAYLDRSAQLVP